jgi:hypothetical protein
MSMHRNATISQVAASVASSDAGRDIKASQAQAVLHIALRTIGLNCLNGRTLDIDLGNGHILHCSVKRAIGPTNV